MDVEGFIDIGTILRKSMSIEETVEIVFYELERMEKEIFRHINPKDKQQMDSYNAGLLHRAYTWPGEAWVY